MYGSKIRHGWRFILRGWRPLIRRLIVLRRH
jgi:hypothetical protein